MSQKEAKAPPHSLPDLSPKEFLKARRPEKFSDSVVTEELLLDRSLLEYHLGTITSRSQEVAFAIFARHLAEREICPNLLPQTGPTGGGDSKVDSETFPVADELALGWYSSFPKEAASERWAFAFSAKRNWRGKAISDVAAAVRTDRDYKKIFFVSNQYIRDKARAELEDKLSRRHRVDVRILDRTWILDRVFTKGHESVAVEDLQLEASFRRSVRKGPLDTQREQDLGALENNIQNAIREGRLNFVVVDDCIEAADLARRLERPRTEVEGLYGRAEQIAERCGTKHQLVKCAYERAKTAFWWHEDLELFSQLYGTVEERTKGTQNAYDLELLTNLWALLHNVVSREELDEESANIAKRTATLKGRLQRLCKQEDCPSTALHARSLRLQVELFVNLASRRGVDSILDGFREVVRSCEGLAGFPLEPLAEILVELGDVLGNVPAYDEMFETVVSVRTGRRSDVTAARLMLRRGAQQLAADNPYGAIRTLGLSFGRLYKYESRSDMIRALYLCGCAYERAGLFWAARGSLLLAASLLTDDLHNHGDVSLTHAACYRRLKWIELRLGRVPHVLLWHEIDTFVRRVLSEKGQDTGEPQQDDAVFDAVLGLLLLKTDHWELKLVTRLPDVLDRLGLYSSSVALLYALGYEDEVRDTFFERIKRDQDEDLHDLFVKWRDQPASADVPAAPSFNEEQNVRLKSWVLGCEITVRSDNSSPSIELAESVLAALESLLSTGAVERMVAREPALTLNVRGSEFAKEPFEFALDESAGRPQVEITCPPFDPKTMTMASQEGFKDTLLRLLSTLFARMVMAPDVTQAFERLVRDEKALDRSVNFTSSFITAANVLGPQQRTQISRWCPPEFREYTLRRASRWDANDAIPKLDRPSPAPSLKFGSGEPPKELLDFSHVKHSEIRTVSLIREALWDRAGWTGIGFAVPDEDALGLPVFALGFTNAGAAAEIFRHLSDDLRGDDSEERLRVSVIRGISSKNPHWYRVILGSNPITELSRKPVHHFACVSRVHTMQPDSGTNLDRFLSSFEKVGKYILTAALFQKQDQQPGYIDCPYLVRQSLFVRQAWEINRNDPDMVGVLPEDDPIVPIGEKNPPILELLGSKRSRRGYVEE